VDERTGHVFVVNMGDGTVSVLDAVTGRLRGTIRVGAQPIALAVDGQRSRVFVVNEGISNLPGSVTVLDARAKGR